MPKRAHDEQREQRIMMEIVVDCYGPEEQAAGWYAYLEDQMQFPFTARCVAQLSTSPLEVGDKVEVIGMAPQEDCEHNMLVRIPWKRRQLAVPLAQLEAVAADEETREAVDDWRYWSERGYEL